MSKVFTFWSVDGGVGKTTLCVNAAVRISELFPKKKVLVIDLNLNNPDIGLVMGTKTKDLKELYPNIVKNGMSFDYIKRQIVTHEKIRNLDVIGGVSDIHFVDKFNLEHFQEFFLYIKQLDYDFIFIDVNGSLNVDATFSSLINADRAIVMAEGTFVSITNTIRYMNEALNKIDKNFKNVELIVNKYHPGLMHYTDIEKAFGFNSFITVDLSIDMMKALNEGIPYVQTYRKSREYKNIVQSIDTLIYRLEKFVEETKYE